MSISSFNWKPGLSFLQRPTEPYNWRENHLAPYETRNHSINQEVKPFSCKRSHCGLIECNGNTNKTIDTVHLCLWDSYNAAVTRQGAVIESQAVKTVMYSALHQGPFSFRLLYNSHIKGLAEKKKKTPVKAFPTVGLTRPMCNETPAVHYPVWEWFEKYSQRQHFFSKRHCMLPSLRLRRTFIITM